MLPDFSLFDLILTPVFVIGREEDGRITYRYCNDSSLKLTGQTRDRMLGRTAVETFGDRLGRSIGQRHEEALACDGRYQYEVTLPIELGESVVRNTTQPLPGHPGVAICTTHAGRSRIAHGRDLSRQAREVEREVSLAQRALGLRGPMRKYGMLIEELKRDFTDLGNGKLALIDEIGRLGEEAYDLVRQVLTYTRAVAARPVQPERIDLGEFCEMLFAIFDPDAEHRLSAEASYILIEQSVLWFVLHELLTQGMSEPGTHEFTVGCRQDKGGMLRINVSCSVELPEGVKPTPCEFPEIETVLRSRGGGFTVEEGVGQRMCSFVLPGRILDDHRPTADGPSAKLKAAPPGDEAAIGR